MLNIPDSPPVACHTLQHTQQLDKHGSHKREALGAWGLVPCVRGFAREPPRAVVLLVNYLTTASNGPQLAGYMRRALRTQYEAGVRGLEALMLHTQCCHGREYGAQPCVSCGHAERWLATGGSHLSFFFPLHSQEYQSLGGELGPQVRRPQGLPGHTGWLPESHGVA